MDQQAAGSVQVHQSTSRSTDVDAEKLRCHNESGVLPQTCQGYCSEEAAHDAYMERPPASRTDTCDEGLRFSLDKRNVTSSAPLSLCGGK